MFHSTAGSSNHTSRSIKRPHSRSNSISSSSAATTVKRTSSLNSAGTASRPTTAPYGASSTTVDGSAGSTARSTASKRRSSVAHVTQDNSASVREGLGNLNRWSQSTASSLSSSGHKRLSSLSKRLSGSANGQALNNAQNNPNSLPPSPRRVLQKRNRSPPSPRKRLPASPTPAVPSLPLNALPPIITLPSLSQAVADANAPSTSTSRTPTTAAPFTPTTRPSDPYLSEGRGSLSPDSKKRPPLQPRTQTAPEKEAVVKSPRRMTNSTGLILPTTIPDTRDRARTPTGKRKPTRDESATPRRRDRSTSDASRFDDRSPGNFDRDTQSRASDRRDKRADKDKKAMLSKALEKANTAVVLDNAQNFEGAIEAYRDACRLLQSVMERSSGEEDKRKLEAIRQTYLNRIDELHTLEPEYQQASGKTLPQRPMSDESLSSHSRKTLSIGSVVDEPAIIGTATVTRIVNDPSADSTPQSRTPRRPPSPRLRESVISSAIKDVESTLPKSVPKSTFLDSSWGTSRSPIKTQVLEVKESMLAPGDRTLMPQPLSPRSPRLAQPQSAPVELPASPVEMKLPRQTTQEQPQEDNQPESMSWLDTIDESDSSCASSVHSVDPRLGIKRKHLRNTSGQSQAEFDAAFDAAVEAAYDDGFEPYEDEVQKPVGTDFITQAMRNVELARERVQEAKREEVIQAAKERERKRVLEENSIPYVRESVAIPYGNQDADDEERMLEEMTREYLDDGFDFGLQNKSALPRESDSSGYTRSTWDSSGRATTGSSLSTVAEGPESRRTSQQIHSKPPPMPPPPVNFSAVSASNNTSNSNSGSAISQPTSGSSSVLNRRFSGQTPKQLKIETKPASNGPQSARLQTSRIPDGPILTPRSDSLQAPKTAGAALGTERFDDSALKILRPELERTMTPNSQDSLPLGSHNPSNDNSAISRSESPSSSFRPELKKNQSSLSLSSRGQTLTVSTPSNTGPSSADTTIPIGLGTSPNLNPTIGSFTPQSTLFRRPATATSFLPTPSASSTFQTGSSTLTATDGSLSTAGTLGGSSSGGGGGGGGAMRSLLLTADLTHPDSPSASPSNAANGGNPLAPGSGVGAGVAGSASAPMPLEPCPTSSLLRPFWLLRAVYQTLAHPRGGYLSTKLFVPRDVWGVRGVKVRGMDEKVAACDLLTAALEKVRVGWEEGGWEVERVAEELSGFETVMDAVQSSLAKKLGQEVGVQGVGGLFRDAEIEGGGAMGEGDGSGGLGSGMGGRKISSGGKNYLSGWRKLRPKNSGAGLTGIAISGSGMAGSTGSGLTKDRDGKDGGAGFTISTLPMTSLANPKFARRDATGLEFSGFGPIGNYMASLARLCDAVQVLDQIARQVEDPGLKHSSPAHVGLEFSARHAAEFFGFYICRFVLADVGMLLDKFIKRGSEWVLV
ncbi:MAG: hypothetical protein Q9165_003894 [Trypethelium subeluteriae]